MVQFDIKEYSVWIYLGMFLLAMVITLYAIPSVIFVSKKKRLLDKPDHRKKHKNVTPNLGGIAIFSAFAFVACLFNIGEYLSSWEYILGGAFLLFVTGLKDDLVSIDPYKKFGAQFMAALIIVFLADIRLDSLHGFLGIDHLPYIISFGLSIVGITFVTNAFNLIDGVDGLAGSLSFLICSFYGIVFGLNHDYGFAMAGFALAGTIVGFLRYNINPAKIFMGDTGSLILGFMVAVMSIAFVARVNVHSENSFISSLFGSGASLSVALAAIIVPVYDTFRVFTLRILKGFSPFHPDRTHIHHVLLDSGFTPNQVSLTLFGTTLLFICGSLVMAAFQLGNTISICTIILAASSLIYCATRMRNRRVAARKAHRKQQEEAKIKTVSPEEYIKSMLNKSAKEVFEESEAAVSYIKDLHN